MPPPVVTGTQLLFAVDGLDQPALGQALQQLTVTWVGARKVVCVAVFGDWGPADGGLPGFLWSDGRMFRPKVKLAVQQGGERVFSGRVVAVESRLGGSEVPAFAVRAAGRSPAHETAGHPARPLRWGVHLLRLAAEVEGSGPTRTTARLKAEAIGDVALGQAALRPGRAIEVIGVGALFAGQYVLTTVGLQFDQSRGLRAELTAQRAPDPP
jgi:hypothetical protein